MTNDREWASARTIYRYFWTLHRHYNLIQWTQLTLGLLWGSYHTWNILHRPKRTGKRNNLKKKKAWQKSESDDNVEEEQKNAEELFINLQLFRDRFVTIHGIIHLRIKNFTEKQSWWYCLQVFSHRLFWVLIVFGGVALAVFLSTSAYLDWQVYF